VWHNCIRERAFSSNGTDLPEHKSLLVHKHVGTWIRKATPPPSQFTFCVRSPRSPSQFCKSDLHITSRSSTLSTRLPDLFPILIHLELRVFTNNCYDSERMTRPVARHLRRATQTQVKREDIHALSRIRTYDLRVSAGVDISCFRRRATMISYVC
jgi:hypothetical protein